MLPDTDIIIACPFCEAQARVFQLLSGNTMGAITWTDGWMDAPMLPRAPRITRCAACRKIYWVAMAAPLGLANSGLGIVPHPVKQDRLAHSSETDHQNALRRIPQPHPSDRHANGFP